MLTMKHFIMTSRRLPCLLALSVLTMLGLLTINLFTPINPISKISLFLNSSSPNIEPEYASLTGAGSADSRLSDYENRNGSLCGEKRSPWQVQLVQKAAKALVAGKRLRTGTGKFLILGIASVFREENYLEKTLSSLIEQSDEEERKDVLVVIYLADTSPNKNAKQLDFIQNHYQQYLDSGFFQVIESSHEIYPPMDFALTKRTFNDSKERVLWRTKQVIDFTFLFTYSQPLADYYLVVEDDVVASPQYITAIRDFISARKEKRWTALQFTGFLGIGLLFRTKDLPKLTQLLIMFHQEQPVDMLMREFITLQVPEVNLIVRRIPSIFQHIGVKSTLPNKVQKLTDNTFNMANRKFTKNRNPSADLITSMKVYNDFVPEYAFRSTPGFFWGIAKTNDTLDIIFPAPLGVSRIVIVSGIIEPKSKIKDPIKDGYLEISEKFQKISANNNVAICDNFRHIGSFQNGNIDVNLNNLSTTATTTTNRASQISQNLTSVQCIRVRIGPGQKSWVIIREIQIFR